jgi:hypothetical protein
VTGEDTNHYTTRDVLWMFVHAHIIISHAVGLCTHILPIIVRRIIILAFEQQQTQNDVKQLIEWLPADDDGMSTNI